MKPLTWKPKADMETDNFSRQCGHMDKPNTDGPPTKLTMALAEKLWAMAYEDMTFREMAAMAAVRTETLLTWRVCPHCNFGELLDEARMEGRYERKQYLNLGLAPQGQAAAILNTASKDANVNVAKEMYLRGAYKGDYTNPDSPVFGDDDAAAISADDEVKDLLAGDAELEEAEIAKRRRDIMERYQAETGREIN